jgi:hypothetical protein
MKVTLWIIVLLLLVLACFSCDEVKKESYVTIRVARFYKASAVWSLEVYVNDSLSFIASENIAENPDIEHKIKLSGCGEVKGQHYSVTHQLDGIDHRLYAGEDIPIDDEFFTLGGDYYDYTFTVKKGNRIKVIASFLKKRDRDAQKLNLRACWIFVNDILVGGESIKSGGLFKDTETPTQIIVAYDL